MKIKNIAKQFELFFQSSQRNIVLQNFLKKNHINGYWSYQRRFKNNKYSVLLESIESKIDNEFFTVLDDKNYYKKSIKNISSILKLDKNNTNALFFRGIAHSNLNHDLRALKIFDNIIKIDPDHKNIFIFRGKTNDKLDDHQKAIEDFSKAIEKNPKYWRAYCFRAESRKKINDFNGALDDLSNAIKLSPKNKRVLLIRSEIKYLIKDYYGAIDDLSEVIKGVPLKFCELLFIFRAELRINTKDYKGAIKELTESFLLNYRLPKDPPSRLRTNLKALKYLIFRELKIIDFINKDRKTLFKRKLITNLIKKYKKVAKNYYKSILYFNRGISKSEKKDYYGAIDEFSKALKLDRSLVHAHVFRALIKNIYKDQEGAIQEITRFCIRKKERDISISLFVMYWRCKKYWSYEDFF